MKIQAEIFVHDRLIDDRDHAALTPGKTYVVIGLCDSMFRIVNDEGEPILYPRGLFRITDPDIPRDWIRHDEPDGSYYIDPPECSAPGFYERVFDSDLDALAALNEVLERLHAPRAVIHDVAPAFRKN
jgi:hypothetical protein